MERLVMSSTLHEAAAAGDAYYLTSGMVSNETNVLLPLTKEGNNCLHIAASLGHEVFVREVLSRFPDHHFLLLLQQNMRGDNPLHVAARAGHLGVVQLLTGFFHSSPTSQPPEARIETNQENAAAITNFIHPFPSSLTKTTSESPSLPIWRIQKHDGSTALHESLRNKHEDVALQLLDLDTELVVFVNTKDESPLYLAAKAGFVCVLNKILEAGGRPSIIGPKDQTPFHAAVFAKSGESIELLYGLNPELIRNQDSYGNTALHYATQEDSLEVMRLLLELDPSCASIINKGGLSPLLVAARKGSSASVRAILGACPTSIESSDSRGRNALHLALTHNTIVKFKKLLSIPRMRELINKSDKEGNTPLHLASMAQKYRHVQTLLSTNCVDLTAKRGALALWQPVHENLSNQQELIKDALENPPGDVFINRYLDRMTPLFEKYGMISDTAEEATEGKDPSIVIEMMSVVAALLATITFTAALQIPGGYKAEGPNGNVGSPLLIHKPAFQAFIFFDTSAFCFSMMALFLLVKASTTDKVSSTKALFFSGYLLTAALVHAMIAFLCGMFVVVKMECKWLAVYVCISCGLSVSAVHVLAGMHLTGQLLICVAGQFKTPYALTRGN